LWFWWQIQVVFAAGHSLNRLCEKSVLIEVLNFWPSIFACLFSANRMRDFDLENLFAQIPSFLVEAFVSRSPILISLL
jgi:hypothetical protein